MKNANKSQIKVLIVEDEPILAELHADFIQRDPYMKALAIASTLADAKLLVDKLKPDLILLDNYLPDGEGIDLFEHIVSHQLNSYVIFITAASDIETCSRAIRYGAFDYLIK
ncbi:MAG: response regulator, partial [Candidatus Schmidhempelia sp.]|nr:response regulator [Candidatus Schmidhempelia sp.]